MTDEELIARLRDAVNGEHDMTPHGADVLLAADRIKALTEQLTAARDDAKEAEAYAEELEDKLAAARQDAKEAEAYVEELEAKLAAAVEALICGRYFHAGEATRAQFIKAYRTAMAEIEGGNDAKSDL